MYIKTGSALLIVWLLGVFGIYNGGSLVHIPLLVGLMLLLLGVLKSRDALADGRAHTTLTDDEAKRDARHTHERPR